MRGYAPQRIPVIGRVFGVQIGICPECPFPHDTMSHGHPQECWIYRPPSLAFPPVLAFPLFMPIM
jgi:hypothetical protein